MVRGYDPSSLGLVRKSPTRPDGRYTAVEYDGEIVWALHPKHFNPSTLKELQQPYENEGIILTNDASIFVDSVDVKGVVSHSESTNITKEVLPIYAGPNAITTDPPIIYAQQLENSDGFRKITDGDVRKIIEESIPEKEWINLKAGKDITESGAWDLITDIFDLSLGMSKWKLAYKPTLFKFDKRKKDIIIKLDELDDIDLNSNSNLTVSAEGGSTISYPLQNALAMGYDEIKITWVNDTFDGFWYTMEFAGRKIQGKYTKELVQLAIITEYVEHMLQNSTYELALNVLDFVRFAKDLTGTLDWDKLHKELDDVIDDMFEGVDTPVNAKNFIDMKGIFEATIQTVEDYALRWSRYNDMKKSSNNVGGTMLNNALWQQIDVLLTIDYPTPNLMTLKNGQRFKPGDFAEYRVHTYDVKTKYNGVNQMMNALKSIYPGEIVGVDCKIIYKYGLYDSYFNDLVSKGALLEWQA